MIQVITNKGTTITLSAFQRYYVLTRFGYWPLRKRKNFKYIPCGTEFRTPGMQLHFTKLNDEIVVGFEERGGGVATEYYNKQTFEI